MKTDDELRRDVLAELEWEPRIDATEVAVAVTDGVVSLTGHVPSYAELCEAERAVGRLYGVKGVENELGVRPPESAERGDAELAAVCESLLAASHMVPSGSVRPTVESGVVRLAGEVQWGYQKRAAEEVVRGLSGVMGVENALTVAPRVPPADVRRMIEDALARAAAGEARRLDVRVDGRTVTLSGNVSSWYERQDAERAARDAPGITHVENRLVVVPNG